MIADRLAQLGARIGDRTALRVQGEVWSYEMLASEAKHMADTLTGLGGQRVGVAFQNVPRLLVTLLALDRLGAIAVLYSATSGCEALSRSRGELKLAEFLSDLPGLDRGPAEEFGPAAGDAADPLQPADGGVVLFTSGTSGPPKPASHTWSSLAAAVRQDDQLQGGCWLLTYDPAKFAGLQVTLQALLTGGRIAVPDSLSPASVARCLKEQQVEFASGTPTFWRMLLHGAPPKDLAGASLRQITLGGEPVDQSLLDAVKKTFPAARITHIYASTEMGTCFSVSDGRAGFPSAYLNDARLPCRLQIADDGQLMIQSSRAMSGYLGERHDAEDWFTTGDLVQIREDRVYFVGRTSDVINVGGNKVHPLEVEEIIRTVRGVCNVRVHGIKSSLVGQLVAAEVQKAPEADAESLREEILAACRDRLAKHKIPAVIRYCNTLATTQAGKLARKVG